MMTSDNRQIVLASGNKGKLAELQKMLDAHAIEVKLQSEFGIGSEIPEADETGLTFVENAIIKARHAARTTGLPVIADDSGLEVDYLNGQPGIYSSRYSVEGAGDEGAGGQGATDAKNNLKLLANLDGVPTAQRTARFHTVLVYMRHAEDPTPVICHDSWEGVILEQARGEKGFGYDPLFFVASENCTAAQLSSATKNRLSHRGKAMVQLKDKLKEIF